MVDPFVGAFRLVLIIATIAALWNGAGWGAIIVAAVLYSSWCRSFNGDSAFGA